MNNPLKDNSHLPLFSTILPEHVIPAIEQEISQAKEQISALKKLKETANWQNFAAILEAIDISIDHVWSTISHLNSVMDSAELREAYQSGKELLTSFQTELAQDTDIYQGFKHIHSSDEFEQLTPAQKRIIKNTIRDFKLSGAELPEKEKQQFAEIVQRLSKLQTQFEQNLLDATQAWYLLITEEEQLAGLPSYAIEMASTTAERHQQTGWRFGLDYPSYLAIMKYADNHEIRETMYRAFVTRASEIGNSHSGDACKLDNSTIIEEILSLRHQKALLLGFNNFAELALTTKMANSGEEVIDFLLDLAKHAKPKAEQEVVELTQFVKANYAQDNLNPWDYSYYSEKLKQEKYQLDSELVKTYFPANNVIRGMFDICQRLFDIQIVENPNAETWHEDVLAFDVLDHHNELIGQLFADLYARPHKRGGAWMGVCRHRQRSSAGLSLPVAYLTCNFTPASKNKPALLTHDEVETLFHEFGHTLHHLLTQVDEMSVAGINGVAWDAVELPSQFLENWCWHPESLPLISAHYETNEPLPLELLNQLLNAKHFQTGMQTVRQLEFALFDIRLHMQNNQSDSNALSVQSVLDQAREEVAVVPAPHYNRFQCSFSHIFAGGYAAGYYSYKWAEVLSADAFDRFETEGIFNKLTGKSFRDNILAQGGVPEAAEMFEHFRGRKPNIDALLKNTGLMTDTIHA